MTWLLFVPALVVLAEAVGRWFAGSLRGAWRWHAAAGALVGVFAGAVAAAPPLGPIHTHATFVARTECGALATCAGGWSWLAPGLDAWAAVVGLWPTLSSAATASAALACAFACLLLVYVLPQLVWDGARGRWVGLAALAAICVQPAYVRVAAGATPYPFVTAVLLGAGVCAAASHRRGSAPHAVAAAALLAIASCSNFVCLSLLPLLVLAPFAWRERGLATSNRRRAVLAAVVVLVAALIVWIASADFARVIALEGHEKRALTGGFVSQLPLRPREFPFGLAFLCAFGVTTLRDRRAWPIVYVYGALTFFFCGTVVDVGTEYPTRFVHSSMAMVPAALLAGLGLAAIVEWCERRGPRVRGAVVALASVVTLASVPLAKDALRFYGESFVITAEFAALDAALGALPAHDLLVVPDAIQRLPDHPPNGDPVEVNFPYAAYRLAYEREHGRTVDIVHLSDFLTNRASADDEVLFYLGSNITSWVTVEIEAGVVPDATYERPDLVALRDMATLEAVRTVEVRSAQPALATQRLAADREPVVALGFYRVHLLEGEARDDANYAHGAGGGRTPDGRARFSIGPGREDDILALFANAELPVGWTLDGVAIERFEIVGRLTGPAEDTATLVLAHPLNTDEPTGQTASFGYRWEAPTEAGAAAARALSEAVERNDNGRFWPRSER